MSARVTRSERTGGHGRLTTAAVSFATAERPVPTGRPSGYRLAGHAPVTPSASSAVRLHPGGASDVRRAEGVTDGPRGSIPAS